MITTPTSQERFAAALEEITTDPLVTVTVEAVNLTVSDPDSPVYNYRRQRSGKKIVAATLYTVRRPSPFKGASERTVQALFVTESGRFVSASHSGIRSPKDIEWNSKSRTSKPLGWEGISLTNTLDRMAKQFHPDGVAAEVVKRDQRNQDDADRDFARRTAQYEEALEQTWAARVEAIAALGTDVATAKVLDHFLPLPTAPVRRSA